MALHFNALGLAVETFTRPLYNIIEGDWSSPISTIEVRYKGRKVIHAESARFSYYRLTFDDLKTVEVDGAEMAQLTRTTDKYVISQWRSPFSKQSY